jgi:hypothetical protein
MARLSTSQTPMPRPRSTGHRRRRSPQAKMWRLRRRSPQLRRRLKPEPHKALARPLLSQLNPLRSSPARSAAGRFKSLRLPLCRSESRGRWSSSLQSSSPLRPTCGASTKRRRHRRRSQGPTCASLRPRGTTRRAFPSRSRKPSRSRRRIAHRLRRPSRNPRRPTSVTAPPSSSCRSPRSLHRSPRSAVWRTWCSG